jgi:pilus assembly protein Flp/PilA
MLRLSNEEGQTMAEYGLIIALIAVVVIAGVTLLGNNLNQLWAVISNAII